MNIESLGSNLIVAALENGVRVDMEYAKHYISACEILKRSSDNKGALITVEHFQLLMSPFGRFTLPLDDYTKHCGDPSPETDEEYRDRMLAHFATIPPLEIVNKCSPFFRPHATVEGWREGIRGFMQRTGLSVEQIRAMSPLELAAYA